MEVRFADINRRFVFLCVFQIQCSDKCYCFSWNILPFSCETSNWDHDNLNEDVLYFKYIVCCYSFIFVTIFVHIFK